MWFLHICNLMLQTFEVSNLEFLINRIHSLKISKIYFIGLQRFRGWKIWICGNKSFLFDFLIKRIHCLKYQRFARHQFAKIETKVFYVCFHKNLFKFFCYRYTYFRAPEIDNPNYPLKGSKGSVYEGGTKVRNFFSEIKKYVFC